MPNREDAGARFKRVAKKRVERILRDLELLARCGDRHNYSYSKEEATKMIGCIDEVWQETKNKFVFRQSRGGFNW